MGVRLSVFALLLVLLAGCGGPGHVEFSEGQCRIDGQTASLPEVEARQARIAERILARQPLFVLVTVLIVALAGASHLEKLVLLFSTRKAHTHGFGERLKIALDRYRVHPVRYFSIVLGTLVLLGCAGGFYVYLDADKRASERALGQLQFCHLALRNSEAEGILAEQRRNLEAIESTAGNIRTLVDKLPPEEQRKAKEIVDSIHGALAHQGKLVGDYMTRTDQSNRALKEHEQLLEKGLSTLEASVLSFKTLPGGLRDLSDQVRALDGHVGNTDAKLAALKASIDALAARPEPRCPVAATPAAAAASTAAAPAEATRPARTDENAPLPASKAAEPARAK